MTQPACPTCVVRSGLLPAEPHYRVVCSVCAGTGIVNPKEKAGQASPSVLHWVLALAFLFIGLTLTVWSIAYVQRSQRELDDVRAGVERTVRLKPGSMSITEIKASVPVGLPADGVRALLGEPDRRHHTESGLASMDIWYYGATDGEVQISIQNDKVIGLSP
jgi:hypothetical protein